MVCRALTFCPLLTFTEARSQYTDRYEPCLIMTTVVP